MANFSHTTEALEGACLLKLEGHIDEDVNFGEINLGDFAALRIDFSGIKSINSCGIREWIKWISPVSEKGMVQYENCPKVIVDQINMVSGFLPATAHVHSFYVPYYSEESDSEKMVLFVEGTNFSKGNIEAPETIVDDATGQEMELDVIESKYFKFLKAG